MTAEAVDPKDSQALMHEDSNHSCSPIFILGVPRSGTTLLSFILDSHPSIAVGRETGVMQGISHLFGDASKEYDPQVKYDLNWFETYGVTRKQFSGYARHFLNSFFSDFAARQGKRRWAEKTPRHTQYCDLIYEIFPEAQFIHIVRDPRAVCASRKLWGHHIGACAREWQMENDKVLAFSNTLHSSQYLRIRYEDLVLRPEESARNIFNFLGEDWDDGVLRHHEVVSHKFVAHAPEKGFDYRKGRVYNGKSLVEGGVQNDPSRSIDGSRVPFAREDLRGNSQSLPLSRPGLEAVRSQRLCFDDFENVRS